jgi:2,4-dienoyl-CoA reductase (NADPH2)
MSSFHLGVSTWTCGTPARLSQGHPPWANPVERFICSSEKKSKIGAGLGKTTGWIHHLQLRHQQVEFLNAVTYCSIDDQGLHITRDGQPILLPVDNVVVCAGQEPLRDLADKLKTNGIPVHVIGGADQAEGLDAKRAIDQGTRLVTALV